MEAPLHILLPRDSESTSRRCLISHRIFEGVLQEIGYYRWHRHVVQLVTMRIWHWKSHWKVQPHWKTTEITLKSFTKDNHTEMLFLMTLKSVCYCYSRMLIPYNPTDNFQSDFQCHILVVSYNRTVTYSVTSFSRNLEQLHDWLLTFIKHFQNVLTLYCDLSLLLNFLFLWKAK